MKQPLKVLIIEDFEDDALLVVRNLQKSGYEPDWIRVDTQEDMLNAIKEKQWDIIICDFSMPQFSALSALDLVKNIGLDIPFIIVSGTIGEDMAVAAMKAGAHDYIMKDNLARMSAAVERELREAKIRAERKQSEANLQIAHYELELSTKELENKTRLLELAVKELQMLDKSKTEFLANISHELRTPLVAIQGYTELMEAKELGPLTDEQKRALAVSRENVSKLAGLIENLLTFSVLEEKRNQLQRQSCDLGKILQNSVISVEPAAKELGITVHCTCPGHSIFLKCNPNILERAFSNILSNAFKFNKKNGRVDINLHSSQNEAIITITDTGIGIPQDKLHMIFERFYQVDSSSTRKYSGVGIGLSLAKDIIELHGGVIKADSILGKETTITVSLPTG